MFVSTQQKKKRSTMRLLYVWLIVLHLQADVG